MKKINFFFHDPSTFNHFNAIVEHMKLIKYNKYEYNLVNMKEINIFDGDIGVYGLSTNQIEVKTAKKHEFSILYIENLIGKRLDGIDKLDFNLVLVCNDECKNEIKSKFNFEPIVIGDTFYNKLINDFSIEESNKYFIEYYTIFLSPDDKNMDIELLNFQNSYDLINLIERSTKDFKILIRFHPRTSVNMIESTKDYFINNNRIIFNDKLTNKEVINNSIMTFGIGTTTYYESIINNVPCCFININNKFTNFYSFFVNDEIIILNDSNLKEFIKNPFIKNDFKEFHLHAINNFLDQI